MADHLLPLPPVRRRRHHPCDGPVATYLRSHGLLSAHGVQLLVRAFFYDADYNRSPLRLSPAWTRHVRHYEGAHDYGEQPSAGPVAAGPTGVPAVVALAAAEAAYVAATLDVDGEDGARARERFTYLIPPEPADSHELCTWWDMVLLGCDPRESWERLAAGLLPDEHARAIRLAEVVRLNAQHGLFEELFGDGGVGTSEEWDQLLAVGGHSPADAAAIRTNAWKEAHAVFCPRGGGVADGTLDVCSTHARPGDRHLLAPQ